MKHKTASIELLERLAQRQAEAAALRLAHRRGQLQQAQERQRDLNAYHHEYQATELNAGAGGISAKRLGDLQKFRRQLAGVLESGESLLSRATEDYNVARETWVKQHRRTQAMSDLVDRKRRHNRQEIDRSDQLAADELAANRADSWRR